MTEVAKKAKLVVDANGVAVQSSLNPFPTVTVLAIGAVATVNATAFSGIEIVRLVSTANCHIAFGRYATIAATANDTYLPADKPEYFNLGGDSYISVIRSGVVAGSLYITPME